MSTLPNWWDDVKFIDGYPGKIVVLARKTGGVWYIAKPIQLILQPYGGFVIKTMSP
ncbi:MAG: glycoside hydrolase family 97 C-terminal domain-containing protein [Ignavibacteria bacterium]|nr:glycoside hydrolase family 97 C-terminal domain-containing protein [Ignavibacteria bacterium]